MTLREQLKQWFINDEEEHYIGTVETVAIEHEKIAEEFAIGFAEWLTDNRKHFIKWINAKITTKQLLEIYKKEKGL